MFQPFIIFLRLQPNALALREKTKPSETNPPHYFVFQEKNQKEKNQK